MSDTSANGARPDPALTPPSRVAHRAQDWEATYADAPMIPWDIGRPQAAFAALAASGSLSGSVLDIGCGTGEHALMAAAAGCTATGIDIAPTAIDRAISKAKERRLASRFLVWDALDLSTLDERFDTVLDCGLFHVLDDADRAQFVSSLAAATSVGGRYYLLCFSDLHPGDWGPRRVHQDEIRSSFTDGWQVESIEPAIIEITTSEQGARAWLATITRR